MPRKRKKKTQKKPEASKKEVIQVPEKEIEEAVETIVNNEVPNQEELEQKTPSQIKEGKSAKEVIQDSDVIEVEVTGETPSEKAEIAVDEKAVEQAEGNVVYSIAQPEDTEKEYFKGIKTASASKRKNIILDAIDTLLKERDKLLASEEEFLQKAYTLSWPEYKSEVYEKIDAFIKELRIAKTKVEYYLNNYKVEDVDSIQPEVLEVAAKDIEEFKKSLDKKVALIFRSRVTPPIGKKNRR